ncbi:MAG: LLM class flavin-dependent oxidoreductase [Acidimicrobiales bacterium]|nr:LLM class flavin-dependent oxidoreductase [Acidimicrobiales bacterium]
MKISLFEEVPVPRPWDECSEKKAFDDRLEQMQLADRVGFHAVWLTEHHFLEEYCHSSAPEIFLAALAATTSRLRLGHGIVHLPPPINHPARTAERIATLDVISGGRVELGTGESSSVAELDGFRADPGKKRQMWDEAMQVLIGCLADTPFHGFQGEHVDMPPRNVVPKPLQKPHPPLWVACTRKDTMDMAARRGIGALSFSFLGPEVFEERVARYYRILEEEGVPMGRAVNANVLCSAGALVCATNEDEAIAAVGETARFFGYGIRHYYVDGKHQPGATNLYGQYLQAFRAGATSGEAELENRLVGPPAKLRKTLLAYESIGVDEVMFLTPPMAHEDVMESLDLFGREVLPEFVERDEALQKQKAQAMEPIIETLMARRPAEASYDPSYTFGAVPVAWDLGTPITEVLDSMESRAKDLEQWRAMKAEEADRDGSGQER